MRTNMRTKLFSLLVGVAVLGSAGAVNAADVSAPTARKVVALTDTQMDGITGGHLSQPPANLNTLHNGTFWQTGKSVGLKFGPPLPSGNGPHTGCGAISCATAQAINKTTATGVGIVTG